MYKLAPFSTNVTAISALSSSQAMWLHKSKTNKFWGIDHNFSFTELKIKKPSYFQWMGYLSWVYVSDKSSRFKWLVQMESKGKVRVDESKWENARGNVNVLKDLSSPLLPANILGTHLSYLSHFYNINQYVLEECCCSRDIQVLEYSNKPTSFDPDIWWWKISQPICIRKVWLFAVRF